MSKTDRPVVLVVDGDRDIAEMARAVLQDEGYQVVVLFDVSPDAIAAAVGAHEPDAVLLDGESEWRGYGSSWQEAADLAKRTRRVPVVMFTAHAQATDEAKAGQSDRSRQAEFAAIVTKPFELDDLLAAVEKATRRSVPFDRSEAADSARSAALAKELEAVGAQEVRPSARREWVTFKTSRGRLMQIYWWQTGGSYLIGRYDSDGKRMENIALTYDRAGAVEICASLVRAEAADL